jgi:lipopolysaccharide biosynthesis glycosyltransferase
MNTSIKLVLTLAIGDFHKKILDITGPSIAAYAQKINADYKVIETSCGSPYFEKFIIGELLEDYEQLIYFDCDTIVRPETPNLFNVVPSPYAGLVDESILGYDTSFEEYLLSRHPDLLDQWRTLWERCCYNTGVMVLNKSHKFAFQRPTAEQEKREYHYGGDQSYINACLLRERKKVFNLPIIYNRIIYYDYQKYGPHYFAFVVHYAGAIHQMDNFFEFLKKEAEFLSRPLPKEMEIVWKPLKT